VGHLICAQEAHTQLGLDRVALVPVGQAPHRELERDPGSEVRADLCERVVAQDERLELLRVEIDRPGRSYTADTLAILRERSPDDELTLILGADQAASLPAWREPERVLALARLAVTARRELDRDQVRRSLEGLPGAERIAFFEMPRVDVSSSLVRERAASGRPIRYLVADTVADAIAAQGLYGRRAATGAGRA
jgi:nicotinate-nucleotide adenylyltransferase